MNLSEEFRRHAAECGHMANFLRDPKNRAAWNTLAERWLRCAEWYEGREPLADRKRRARAHKKSDLRAHDLAP